MHLFNLAVLVAFIEVWIKTAKSGQMKHGMKHGLFGFFLNKWNQKPKKPTFAARLVSIMLHEHINK